MESAATFLLFLALIVGGILIFLAAFLAFLSQLFAAGGWGALAERFRAEEQPEGVRFNMQQIMIGLVRYHGCTVVSSARSLYLRMLLLPFHPPLLIPWHEFGRVQDAILYWRRAKRLTIGDPPIAHLTAFNDLYERVIHPYLSPRET